MAQAAGEHPENTEIHVGALIAHSPAADPEPLCRYARAISERALAELDEATRARWIFDVTEPVRLSGDEARRPSDFLDEASLRMAEGPYDAILVVTDVPLVSRRQRQVPGLASEVSRVAVLSTRKLLLPTRGEGRRSLGDRVVELNGAALLLHLLLHLLGVRPGHAPEWSTPFRYRPDLSAPLRLPMAAREAVRRAARRFSKREYHGDHTLGSLAFHLSSALRHPGLVLRPILRNRALLMPLSLPSLATAAVAPVFILIFTAEIWDVGLNITSRIAWISAALTVVAAALYLVRVQDLFFPRKERAVVPEYLAIVNVSILLSLLLAAIGLFLMVGLLVLVIEFLVFPPGLIRTWPTLEDPVVTVADRIRLAVFVSTLGVVTGALAGGLESRTVIRHLALFEDQP